MNSGGLNTTSPSATNVIIQYEFDECYSWGMNNNQLGVENKVNEQELINFVSQPSKMKVDEFFSGGAGEKIAHVSSGGSHTILVSNQFNVYAMGRNQNGQLGIGSFEDSPTPKKVVIDQLEDDDHIVSVSCGDRHTVFLSYKGRVFVCGANFNYQLGLGHNTHVSKPVLVDQIISRKIRRVVCGARHTILITGKGKIYTAGMGSYGQLGHGDFSDQPYFKKIEDIEWLCSSCSSKEHVNVALSSKYEVYQWGGKNIVGGDEQQVQPVLTVPTLLMHSLNGRRIVQVAASTNHALARTSDGSVYCWGYALDNAGYVRLLKNLELSDENIMSKPFLVEAEKSLSEMNLDLSGKYILKKNELTVYRNHFFSSNKIVWIACSETCNYVVNDKGEVFVFGKGRYGETGLGNSKTVDYPEKISVLDGKTVLRVVASGHSAFALTGDASKYLQTDENLIFEEQ